MDEDNMQTVNYRLTNIEKTLNELKNVVLENKLQARDIQTMNTKVDELEQSFITLENRVRILEIEPDKEKASKWEFIVDSIFKACVLGVISMALAKLKL